jgi:VWFA-related protein
MRRALFLLLVIYALAGRGAAAPQDEVAAKATASGNGSTLRITSPLGRTGLVTTVRIVAQISAPPGVTLAPVEFFVDGTMVGKVADGPPYAVSWTDENPFEKREIVVQTTDSTGAVLRDRLELPSFEVTDKTEVTSILLETSVYDRDGDFVSNFDQTKFAVEENGVEQTIELVTRESVPTDTVLLVDNSQSMSRRMEFVRSAAEHLALGMGKRDRAIVAPFNAHIGSITGPTADSATIAQAIGAMKAGGGTALLDALLEATKLLEQSDGRRTIVLLTDGYDENSSAKADEVVRAAESAHVTVYAVGVSGVAGISLKGEDFLRRIATSTGGRFFLPLRDAELVKTADAISTDVRNRYLITYTPQNQKHDGLWREVKVEVPEGFRARTREGYFAPPPPPIRPTIEFTVKDALNRYIEVTKDDFDVYEDGALQAVDTFQEAVDPVSIVLTIDESGSMKPATDLVKETAKDFVKAVRPEDSLALITFADKPKFAHVLSLNRQWSIDAINEYTPNGGTALYDALWNSLQHLKGVPGRHAVVVLTDGRDENNPGTAPGSLHKLDEVLALRKEVNATIFVVGLGANVDKPVTEKLAEESGGQTYYASDATALGEQFRQVVEDLRRRYVLSYVSSNSRHDGGWRILEIRPRQPGHVVLSNGGYFAPDN